MESLEKIATENELTLKVPANDFEINLYKQVIKASIATSQDHVSSWMLVHVGEYNGDGTFGFSVSKAGLNWGPAEAGGYISGRIAVYAKWDDKVQVAWDVTSDDAPELKSQANYAGLLPVVSWTPVAR